MIPCAAILAGGKGTRLSPVTGNLPKALAPIAGRPFIYRQLDALYDAGVRLTVLCTGIGGEQIADAVGPWHRDMKLIFSRESSPLGTGGALRHAAPYFNTDAVLVLNGDTFIRENLKKFSETCAETRTRAGMLLAHSETPGACGTVRMKNGKIFSFDEKTGAEKLNWVNAGVYYAMTELIAALPPGPLSLEHHVFPAWSKRGLLRGFPSDAPFIDIGTPESFSRAQNFFGVVNA